MKRIVKMCLLALCMLYICLLPLRAEAAEIVDSGTCGDNLTWTLDSKGTLTISGEGEMKNYTQSTDTTWNSNWSKIKAVVIERGVTSIGVSAFRGCTSLTSVDIPKGVTSIGYLAFSDCRSLTSITIPDGVVEIGLQTFSGCSSLTSITIPGSVTKILDSAFDGCSNLTSAGPIGGNYNIQLGWTESIPPYSLEAFPALTSVTIPDGVTSVDIFAFSGCTSLTSVDIPESVTSIGDSAFSGCISLTSVDIPKGVTSIGASAFSGCTKLTSVDIAEGVTSIGAFAFSGCRSLTKVTIPEGVTGIGRCCFSDCTNLTKVTIPEGITKIEDRCFSGCTSLTSITIPDGVTLIDSEAFSGCSNLTGVEIPQSVTRIKDQAFFKCMGLKEVSLPLRLEEINKSAFEGCISLESMVIPKSVISISKAAFKGCTALTSVTMSRSAKLSSIWDEVFYGTGLTEVCIPDGVQYINDSSFRNCKKLTSVTIPGSVRRVNDYAFDGCVALAQVCYEGTEADWENINIMSYNDPLLNAARQYIQKSNEVSRVSGSGRWDTAIKTADALKEVLGVEKFSSIIVASGNDFADALAGSYLSTQKRAPILLSWGKGGKYASLDTDNINYIRNNLTAGGTVYILGGTSAVPSSYETDLSGIKVVRLAGGNRYETNLAILKEAGVADGSEILVCTGVTFADSLSAAATGKPILLVQEYNGKVYGIDAAFLNGHNYTFTIIGGTKAVSDKLMKQLEAYGKTYRLAGSDRFETSVLVAEKYFYSPDTVVLAYAWNYPDGLCGGALAYAMNAPLILTMDKYESAAAQYVQSGGIDSGYVLGGANLISDATVDNIFTRN